jgi:hypothetical protein
MMATSIILNFDSGTTLQQVDYGLNIKTYNQVQKPPMLAPALKTQLQPTNSMPMG